MAMWNPWRGCHRVKEGCKYCYTFTGDQKKGIDTNAIVKTTDYDKPIRKINGKYVIKSGSKVYVCFASDFLIEEADQYRMECFEMIKKRNDCHFIFLTKRIERFKYILPKDWGEGYDNVTIGVSVSTQNEIDFAIPLLQIYPIKHRNIVLQPLIEEVSIENYLSGIERVILGGEYGKESRPLHYNWVLKVRNECINKNTSFEFRQCATHFFKENKEYRLKYHELTKQAKKANINYTKIR